ncbi:MAG: dephospho-CoA kinase [Flavobacteriaceae bacterium]|nr:dephospho-CoA kinase [Muriicola sp.]MBT8291210.1 dephospho-CoA kinase [Muriicola sp.]NNK36409.1 dephospho-CoA kinase [Eudoraea sp.]NNL39978.1 dephospho-CoA kinase [Flavobacteriaceae bacterium]
MKKVGLTGGMGSGKTTVAKMFKELGIPVYNSDLEARRIMNENTEVRKAVKALFGDNAYENDQLNRAFIAKKVFGNSALLEELNKVVHPAVRKDFRDWAARQSAPYVIQEAAILFESGGHEHFDHMILVTAPKKTRIIRIKQRDQLSEKDILERMKHQWSEKRKKALADYVIHNSDLLGTNKKVRKIHEELIRTRVKQ